MIRIVGEQESGPGECTRKIRSAYITVCTVPITCIRPILMTRRVRTAHQLEQTVIIFTCIQVAVSDGRDRCQVSGKLKLELSQLLGGFTATGVSGRPLSLLCRGEWYGGRAVWEYGGRVWG